MTAKHVPKPLLGFLATPAKPPVAKELPAPVAEHIAKPAVATDRGAASTLGLPDECASAQGVVFTPPAKADAKPAGKDPKLNATQDLPADVAVELVAVEPIADPRASTGMSPIPVEAPKPAEPVVSGNIVVFNAPNQRATVNDVQIYYGGKDGNAYAFAFVNDSLPAPTFLLDPNQSHTVATSDGTQKVTVTCHSSIEGVAAFSVDRSPLAPVVKGDSVTFTAEGQKATVGGIEIKYSQYDGVFYNFRTSPFIGTGKLTSGGSANWGTETEHVVVSCQKVEGGVGDAGVEFTVKRTSVTKPAKDLTAQIAEAVEAALKPVLAQVAELRQALAGKASKQDVDGLAEEFGAVVDGLVGSEGEYTQALRTVAETAVFSEVLTVMTNYPGQTQAAQAVDILIKKLGVSAVKVALEHMSTLTNDQLMVSAQGVFHDDRVYASRAHSMVENAKGLLKTHSAFQTADEGQVSEGQPATREPYRF